MGTISSTVGTTKLIAGGSVTNTTIDVRGRPPWWTANAGWVVITKNNIECEARKITGIATISGGYRLSFTGGLAYNHAIGDTVEYITSGVLNVKWFGAIGDGATDDAVPFQRAINQFGTTDGGQLFIPNSTYLINSSLDLTNRQNIQITGESRNRTILHFAVAGRACLDLNGSSRMMFRDFTISGDAVTIPACAVWMGRSTTNSDGGQIRWDHVYVTGSFTSCGFYNQSSENNSYNRCYVWITGSTATAGFWIGRANEFSLVSDYVTPGGSLSQTVVSIHECLSSSQTITTCVPYVLADQAQQVAIRDSYAAGGAAYGVRIVGNHAGITIDNLREESGRTAHIRLESTSGAVTVNSLRVLNGNLASGTDFISATADVTVDGITVEDIDSVAGSTFLGTVRAGLFKRWADQNQTLTITTLHRSVIYMDSGQSLSVTNRFNYLVYGPDNVMSFNDRILQFRNGTPEGSISAPVGSLYMRTDGGAGTTMYVKESGTGNTGWIAK